MAPLLGFDKEFMVLDALVGSILGTRSSQLTTVAGKARTAPLPYDPDRLALFEKLAVALRSTPLRQPADVATTPQARTHFAFLESYFSNFIEGTEFEVKAARAFVLEGRPIEDRPKDSHDILGVFRQAVNPAWRNQVLAIGEPVIVQLQAGTPTRWLPARKSVQGSSRSRPTERAIRSSSHRGSCVARWLRAPVYWPPSRQGLPAL